MHFSQSPNTSKCILLRPFMTSSGTSNAFFLHLTCLLTHRKCIVQTNKMFRMQKLQPIQATCSQMKCIFCSIRLVLFETIEMHFSVIVTISSANVFFLVRNCASKCISFKLSRATPHPTHCFASSMHFWKHFYVCSFPDEMCCLQFNHSTRPKGVQARARTRARKEKKIRIRHLANVFFLQGHFDFENF